MTRHPKLDEFIRLFNEERFFEAHEVLEELWLVSNGEQKTFYQGLIQCAVALAHWKKNNSRGANQVGQRSFSILGQFGDTRETVCVAELIDDCEFFLASGKLRFPQIKTTSD
jgi:predicted metal-dependent hydrolase